MPSVCKEQQGAGYSGNRGGDRESAKRRCQGANGAPKSGKILTFPLILTEAIGRLCADERHMLWFTPEQNLAGCCVANGLAWAVEFEAAAITQARDTHGLP